MVGAVQFDNGDAAQRKEDADQIREIADQVERGEVTECIIVCNDRSINAFYRFGTFTDRWRMLGAIEYAKSAVNHAD